MFTLPRLIQGSVLSFFVSGCAAQQVQVEKAPVQKPSVQEIETTPETAPSDIAEPDPIGCADVPTLLNQIEAKGYEGEELTRMIVGSLFSMAAWTSGRVVLRDDLHDQLIRDLGKVTDLAPDQQFVFKWLAAEKGHEGKVSYECSQTKLDKDTPLKLDVPDYYAAPFRSVDATEIKNLLGFYGLRVGPDLRQELGGRVLSYLYKKESPHLVMVYLTRPASMSLSVYSATLQRQMDVGLRHVAILGFDGPQQGMELSESSQDYVKTFGRSPGDPEKALAAIGKRDPDFRPIDAVEYYLMSQAQLNPAVYLYGVDDPGLLYLVDRLSRFTQAALSPYLRRYFFGQASRFLFMRSEKVIQSLQQPLPPPTPLKVVRFETHGGIGGMIDLQHLEQSGLSYILVRSD